EQISVDLRPNNWAEKNIGHRGYAMNGPVSLFENVAESIEERMAFIVATMREMSTQTDPIVMRRLYGQRMRQILPLDGSLSLSRRDLDWPNFLITRSSKWTKEIDPWRQPHLLPKLQGGILAGLIYGDEPRLFDDLEIDP